jgi:hypothetical protein
MTDLERRSVLAGFAMRVLRLPELIEPTLTTPYFETVETYNRIERRNAAARQVLQAMATNWRYDLPMLDKNGALNMVQRRLKQPQDSLIAIPQYEFARVEPVRGQRSHYLRAEMIIAETGLSLQQKDVDLGIALSVVSACDPEAEPRNPAERLIRRIYDRTAYEDPLETSDGDAHDRYVRFGLDLRAISSRLAT